MESRNTRPRQKKNPRRSSSRLNYNRTKGSGLTELLTLNPVGSAAVRNGIEHTEQHLAKILKHAEAAAEKDKSARLNHGI
ncbi:MAG: hypothetical protein CM15mP47_2300 [Methanobacteriota archaeon]|nr:MAG: hypothetical protein CM15mP47_2300 [Euryarchaeota archaeon]